MTTSVHNYRRIAFKIVGVIAGALVLGGAARAAALTAQHAQVSTFADPSGDSGTAADLTSVSVSSDSGGQITFTVNFAGAEGGANIVDVFIDTDENASTGAANTDGAEFVLQVRESNNSYGLGRWDGSSWQDAPAPTATAMGGNGTDSLTLSVNASDLGNVSGFDFWVDSYEGDGGSGHEDQAPDAGTWNYRPAASLQLQIEAFKVVSPPKAGHEFAVVLLTTRSDTDDFLGSEGAVTCTASIGTKRLPATTYQVTVIQGGTRVPVAECEWSLPKQARGKVVHGTISVSYAGVTAARPFSLRIR